MRKKWTNNNKKGEEYTERKKNKIYYMLVFNHLV